MQGILGILETFNGMSGVFFFMLAFFVFVLAYFLIGWLFLF